jgi:hypothetical protein
MKWSLHHTFSTLQISKSFMHVTMRHPHNRHYGAQKHDRGLNTVQMRTGQWSPQEGCLRDSSLASAPLSAPMRAQRAASNSATILNISPVLCVYGSFNNPARLCCVKCVFALWPLVLWNRMLCLHAHQGFTTAVPCP